MHLSSLPQRNKIYVLAGVLLAMTLGALDGTIVGPAMPVIVQELGGMQLLAWVFTIYSLTSTIAIPIVGKLSDLYGRKWFYMGGIALFLVGSVLCGAAPNMTALIIFRGIQGLGGGMMMANGMAIIGDLFEPRERGRYQGLMGAVFGLSSVVGPGVGGWLTDAFSWRWIFYINMPFGILALVVLFLTMPKPEHGQQHAVDWWGATALTAGVVPLLLALNWGGSEYAWGSPMVLGLLAASAVALVLFGLAEMRAKEPILDLKLFRDGSFSASMTVLFLSGVGMFGAVMYLPIFMQIVQGRTASSSGALLMPMMLSMVLGSTGTGQLISRTGRYKSYGIIGMAAATAGMFVLSRIGVDTGNAPVIAAMMLTGFGIGITMPLFTISLQSQFPDRMGEVTGALQFFRSIGGTVGVAFLGGAMNARFADELGALVVRDAEKFGAARPLLARLADEPSKLLNADSFAMIAAQVPAEARPVLERFFADVRLALTTGITHSFFWAFLLLAAGFLAMWFVREQPLHGRPQLDTPSEVAREFMTETAVQPADHEADVFEDLDGAEPAKS